MDVFGRHVAASYVNLSLLAMLITELDQFCGKLIQPSRRSKLVVISERVHRQRSSVKNSPKIQFTIFLKSDTTHACVMLGTTFHQTFNLPAQAIRKSVKSK